MGKMVEIGKNSMQQNGHSINNKLTANGNSNSLNSTELSNTNKKRFESINEVATGEEDALPEPNLELVSKVRQLLSTEWNKDVEHSERVYSKYHYDEIMEAGAPCTCWRYLLHVDEDVSAAFELAKTNLIWRQENRVDVLQAKDMIKDLWLRAPIGFVGKTRSGHDVIYAVGKNYRKPDAIVKQTVRDFIAYLALDWDRKHRNDLNQFVIVFDVSDTGLRNLDLDFSAWLVSIRDIFPARVKALYFVGIPFIVRPVIRMIISWLPERYRRITVCGTFDELVNGNIDTDNQPEDVGGRAPNSWRLAPSDSCWATDINTDNAQKIYGKICEATSFNANQEKLDALYKMQRDHEHKEKA